MVSTFAAVLSTLAVVRDRKEAIPAPISSTTAVVNAEDSQNGTGAGGTWNRIIDASPLVVCLGSGCFGFRNRALCFFRRFSSLLQSYLLRYGVRCSMQLKELKHTVKPLKQKHHAHQLECVADRIGEVKCSGSDTHAGQSRYHSGRTPTDERSHNAQKPRTPIVL